MKLRKFQKRKWYARASVAVWKKLSKKAEKRAQEMLRNDPDKFVHLMFPNPLIAAQANDELVFEPNYYLGHTFSEGRDFIGEKGFLTFEQIIKEIKLSGKKVILNIGDSSTSGWDHDIVSGNRERKERGEPVELPFFRYKTYSDCLRDFCGKDYIVLNAGVPAHTSIHGVRRLELLIRAFKEAGVKVNIVTVYYGNNDSSWNGNKRDIDTIPSPKMGLLGRIKEALFEEFVHVRLSMAKRIQKKAWKKTADDIIMLRTSLKDYENNLKEIIMLCSKNNITPVFIDPQTPLYWKPGARVKGEKLRDVSNFPGAKLVYSLLTDAKLKWNTIIQEKYSLSKIEVLKQIREMDFVVPRVKEKYMEVLRKTSKQTNAPLVKVEIDRTGDDIKYFCDYCHPIEPANIIIAKAIERVIKDSNKPFLTVGKPKIPFKYKLLNVFVRILSIFPSNKRKSSREQAPDIYTLW